MIDCNITENFLKERNRMCDNSHNGCSDCGISDINNGKHLSCGAFCGRYPQEAIAIVQKWSDEHPQKTMLDDFKTKHPDAPMNNRGIPRTCPYNLGYDKGVAGCPKNAKGLSMSCSDCWNRLYNEEEQK